MTAGVRPRLAGWALATLAAAGAILGVLGFISLRYGVPVVRERSGWFLLALVLLVSGVQFLLFGLVSEVIVRIYYFPGQAKPYLLRTAPGPASRAKSPEVEPDVLATDMRR